LPSDIIIFVCLFPFFLQLRVMCFMIFPLLTVARDIGVAI
jgi:hypothetical protein